MDWAIQQGWEGGTVHQWRKILQLWLWIQLHSGSLSKPKIGFMPLGKAAKTFWTHLLWLVFVCGNHLNLWVRLEGFWDQWKGEFVLFHFLGQRESCNIWNWTWFYRNRLLIIWEDRKVRASFDDNNDVFLVTYVVSPCYLVPPVIF